MCATFCEGCGLKLGWRKYRFTRLWRIPGVYCRDCMIKVGKNFESSDTGEVTLPRRECTMCRHGFYFLNKRHEKLYCVSCFQAVTSGLPSARSPKLEGDQASVAEKLVRPLVVDPKYAPVRKYVIFVGGTGAIFMAAGLVFTFYFMATDPGLFTFLYGSVTSVMGFILLRKAMKVRGRLIAGTKNIENSGV